MYYYFTVLFLRLYMHLGEIKKSSETGHIVSHPMPAPHPQRAVPVPLMPIPQGLHTRQSPKSDPQTMARRLCLNREKA